MEAEEIPNRIRAIASSMSDPTLHERIDAWKELNEIADSVSAITGAVPDPTPRGPADPRQEAAIIANGIIPGMCMTWDHSFGIMEQAKRDSLLRSFSQVADHNVRPAVETAIQAERDRYTTLLSAAEAFISEAESMGYGKTSEKALQGSFDALVKAVREVKG